MIIISNIIISNIIVISIVVISIIVISISRAVVIGAYFKFVIFLRT